MTRAEDWLIVAGAGAPEKVEGTWYELAEAGLKALGAREEPAPPGAPGPILAYDEGGAPKADASARAQAAAPPAPDWLTRRPSAPPRAPARHAASALGEAHERRAGGDLPPDLARLKGEAIHAALEDGSMDPAAIRGAVARFPLSDALVDEAAAEAARARALPEAAPFFAPEALAEVGVAVEIAGARLVGRIDRLVASPGRVDFVDFKSDAAPPPEGEPPAAYLAQLAAYRAALRRLHPEAEVEAHILWTAVPRLERIAPETLDEATVAAALAAP
ncbi:MAG: PD-(D/E)XK nuclease family protein, partial [Pseudomonadota bacterium]